MFLIKTKVSHEQTFYLAFRNASLLSRFFFKNVVVREIYRTSIQYINNLSVNDSFELLLRTTVRHHPPNFR